MHVNVRWIKKPNINGPGERVSLAFEGGTGSRPGVNYLGYGLVTIQGNIQTANENGTIPNKSCFAVGEHFVLELLFRKDIEGTGVADEIENALKLMGMIGGLGSRKRRGWGSLALLDLKVVENASLRGAKPVGDDANGEAFTLLVSEENFRTELRNIIALDTTVPADQFPLSAFGKGSKIYLWNEGFDSAFEAMNKLGHGYHLYRGWGHRGRNDAVHKVGGMNAIQNFKPDHDWYTNNKYNWNTTRSTNKLPERANLGLPLGFQKQRFPNLDVDSASPFGRRASPLMFHIAKIGGKYWPVAIWLDNMFLPETGAGSKGGIKIKICGNGGHLFTPDKSVITDYFDGNIRAAGRGTHTYFDGSEIDLAAAPEAEDGAA